MKVKELIELLKTMKPESIIRVAGGNVDYGTTEVEVFEVDGNTVNVQEK